MVTNSLESTTDVAAQSGYARHRMSLLEEGAETVIIAEDADTAPNRPHS